MNPEIVNKRPDTAVRNLKALGFGALAISAIGNGMIYDLPRLNKPVDVPGLNAFVTPGFVHNSGYDMHLGGADLVVNTPGRFTATITKGETVVDSKSFVVSNSEPTSVQFLGTPRGGLIPQYNSGVGCGWANFPGEFTLTIAKSDGQNYSEKF